MKLHNNLSACCNSSALGRLLQLFLALFAGLDKLAHDRRIWHMQVISERGTYRMISTCRYTCKSLERVKT